MIEVTIHYVVPDCSDHQFKELNDIAKDVERELWDNHYFAECCAYSINVEDDTTKVFISHKKREEYNYVDE